MPVSDTDTRRRSVFSRSTVIRTYPWWVNLRALFTRLVNTWRILPASPKKYRGVPGQYRRMRSKPRSSAFGSIISATSSTARRRSKATDSMASLPASILEQSIHADDSIQRCADFVTHVSQKLTLCPARRLGGFLGGEQLSGPLRNKQCQPLGSLA